MKGDRLSKPIGEIDLDFSEYVSVLESSVKQSFELKPLSSKIEKMVLRVTISCSAVPLQDDQYIFYFED